MGTYQKTKVIQSYLIMLGSYDPIELGPSEPKNGGIHGTKRIEFLAQNLHFLDPIGLIWACIWPIFWYSDQLIGSVGLGAGCISQDTYLLYTY